MPSISKVEIKKLKTGVPGLDDVMGGGIPEYSFNLVVGSSGAGKTTLAHQIMFANASAARPALYFTIIGEPPIKLLRYQQQYAFFDPPRVNEHIFYAHVHEDFLGGHYTEVIREVSRQVEARRPGIVVVDSFSSVIRSMEKGGEHVKEASLQGFIYQLANLMTSWQATTFLIAEVSSEQENSALFTIADGVIWLSQTVLSNAVVRKLQISKLRGQREIPGQHTVRITTRGIEVFPRLPVRESEDLKNYRKTPRKISLGVPGLDDMLQGGIPEGSSILITGPTGAGKTILSMQFLAEGVHRGEPGLIAFIGESPSRYVQTNLFNFPRFVDEEKVTLLALRPLDLSVDETMQEIVDTVHRHGVKRMVLDSLSAFELALSPHWRQEFRESLYRLVWGLTNIGVTVVLTVEAHESFPAMELSPHGLSFMSDVIIAQRYLEMNGQLSRVLAVIKARDIAHSKDFRLYDITSAGCVVGQTLKEYDRVLSGYPTRRDGTRENA
jgi:circadian clock protein KaiC